MGTQKLFSKVNSYTDIYTIKRQNRFSSSRAEKLSKMLTDLRYECRSTWMRYECYWRYLAEGHHYILDLQLNGQTKYPNEGCRT